LVVTGNRVLLAVPEGMWDRRMDEGHERPVPRQLAQVRALRHQIRKELKKRGVGMYIYPVTTDNAGIRLHKPHLLTRDGEHFMGVDGMETYLVLLRTGFR
jgi:hypothetical protein